MEGCELQDNELQQFHQKQKEIWGKYGAVAEKNRGPGDTRHRKLQATQCLLHLNLAWYNWPSGIPAIADRGQ